MLSNAPPLRWQVFHVHKRGNTPGEYEDAFAGDVARGRFAVADGASESSFAGTWAKLLVEGFIEAAGKPWRAMDWLDSLRQRWTAKVDSQLLPWYAEAKREQGAFATLLGVAFHKAKRKTQPAVWRALAVGDSCLFRMRAGQLRRTFPLMRSTDFGNLPSLLGSRNRLTDTPPQGIKRARGKWRPGDRFLLMTDALAEWTLRQTEQNGRPGAEIDQLLAQSAPQDTFAAWIEERRDRHGLRNDDVTLLILDL